jgi:D-glycero-D-manno-heptose 1,7-bisphosphate phosphatase
MNKCVFLDRDGVINVDCVDYTYKVEDFKIIDGVHEALKLLKNAGYLLIVITNQSGIAKGIYGHEDVKLCHDYLQEETGHLIDAFYYSPYHEKHSSSFSRKPGTLMFERAIARFNIDPEISFMIGDKERDLIPAKKVHIKAILLPEDGKATPSADFVKKDLLEAAKFILSCEKK